MTKFAGKKSSNEYIIDQSINSHWLVMWHVRSGGDRSLNAFGSPRDKNLV